MCVAVCVAVCVAMCVAVCVAVCVEVCVAVCVTGRCDKPMLSAPSLCFLKFFFLWLSSHCDKHAVFTKIFSCIQFLQNLALVPPSITWRVMILTLLFNYVAGHTWRSSPPSLPLRPGTSGPTTTTWTTRNLCPRGSVVWVVP